MNVGFLFRLPGVLVCCVTSFCFSGCVVLLPFIESDLPRERDKCCPHTSNAQTISELNFAPAFTSSLQVEEAKVLQENPVEAPAVSSRKPVEPSISKVDLLISQLKNKSDVVRTHAATDLGFFGGKAVKAVPALASALKNDQSKWVRRACAKSLGKIGTAESIAPLSAALRDRDKWVAYSAKRSLDKLGA